MTTPLHQDRCTTCAISHPDSGDVAALFLLDLYAAFVIDHDILLRRLHTSFGISGAAIQWYRLYLTDRSQYV